MDTRGLVWATGGGVGIVSMSVGWEHDHLLDKNWESKKKKIALVGDWKVLL